MEILAIETSCDDTSVAIVRNGTEVLSSVVSSQTKIHSGFGGVVPEVAAREHIKNMIPVLDEALNIAKKKIEELDYIAVTKGPGLIGSLIVGVNTARILSELYNKQLIALHHVEGHIYANWLEENLNGSKSPEFPLVCLTVSGGHSNLILMKNHLEYLIIGETQDDAAGEAFDKVAKMLNLSYPGGPEISKHAEEGDSKKFHFPRVDLTAKPKRNDEGYLIHPEESLDFSFSGLKTAVLREVYNLNNLDEDSIRDISASFQEAVNETLTRNLIRAVEKFKPKSVLLSGGVAANHNLREMIQLALAKHNLTFYFPKPKFCTDNAAMIAAAAFYHIKNNHYTDPKKLIPEPNLRLR